VRAVAVIGNPAASGKDLLQYKPLVQAAATTVRNIALSLSSKHNHIKYVTFVQKTEARITTVK